MRAMMQSYFFLLFCRFFFFSLFICCILHWILCRLSFSLSLFFCLFLHLILLLCVSLLLLLLLFWLLSPLYSNLSIGFSSATVVTVYYYAMLCYLIGSTAAAASCVLGCALCSSKHDSISSRLFNFYGRRLLYLCIYSQLNFNV